MRRPGVEDERPQRRNIDSAEPSAEIRITVNTDTLSDRDERTTTPGTEAVFRIERKSDPEPELWRRAYAIQEVYV